MSDPKYVNIKVVTNKPVAVDSPDHICPVGAVNDNHSHSDYIEEVISYFPSRQLKVLDLGCAGGQLAVDFSHRGHFSIGLEGSSFSRETKRFNWKQYSGTILHNADLTEPFEVQKDGEKILFDCISAWEVIEHFKPEDLQKVFDHVESNLAPGGIFVGSINTSKDERTLENGEVIVLHQSLFTKEEWLSKILKERNVVPYPFKNAVRVSNKSFNICLRKNDE